MTEMNLEGMNIAEGVVETIVAVALHDIEGVACLSGMAPNNILSQLGAKQVPQSVEATVNDQGKLVVGVHLEADYGYPLPEVAERVRSAVADAVLTQVGAEVAAVDIYVDGIQF